MLIYNNNNLYDLENIYVIIIPLNDLTCTIIVHQLLVCRF